jgi:hypothetical protein
MWPLGVVVLNVLVHDMVQMPLAEEDEVVKSLGL